jgi:hypothetical protein
VIRLYDTKKHTEGRRLPIYGEMVDAIARRVETTTRTTLSALGSPVGKVIALWSFGQRGLMRAKLLGLVAFCSMICDLVLCATW